jgi:hypothetical protein
VQHLQNSGFSTKVLETKDLDMVKTRLGVPDDLAACHTAEFSGYVIEGHVPAVALKRLLAEKPDATGLAVPGMPVGSPGMEGGRPEKYDVVLFGPNSRRTYLSFIENRPSERARRAGESRRSAWSVPPTLLAPADEVVA